MGLKNLLFKKKCQIATLSAPQTTLDWSRSQLRLIREPATTTDPAVVVVTDSTTPFRDEREKLSFPRFVRAGP